MGSNPISDIVTILLWDWKVYELNKNMSLTAMIINLILQDLMWLPSGSIWQKNLYFSICLFFVIKNILLIFNQKSGCSKNEGHFQMRHRSCNNQRTRGPRRPSSQVSFCPGNWLEVSQILCICKEQSFISHLNTN